MQDEEGNLAVLSLCEWKDAEGSVWIDPGEVEKLDNALDKSLAKDMKIAYQTGKGNKHLVPVSLQALRIPCTMC